MAAQEFTVLYTHQKMKKSKTWQDGILRITTGRNKAVLFDDKGQCLESIFITSQVNAGDHLEGERYLITVEAVKANEKSLEDQPRKAETPAADRNGVKPGVLPPRHLSVGLKRKFTGFQGPRQVEKKISTMEDGEKPTTLPLSKECQGTLPSKFYMTSPLFSTICKKDAETSLSAGFREDVCTDSDREHPTLSSLLSAPFLDRCEEAEKQNSGQSVGKPGSPVIPGHAKSGSQRAGHGAVSHSIRSTAQIIALLKSKPSQGCREQTKSEVAECLSGFQASENTDGSSTQKSTILPAFPGNPAKRLLQNTQHLPFTKGTVKDEKEWNTEMLPNSAEQPCDKEVTGQRHDKKANNFNRDLQDPCNTNSCFLRESTVSGMSDSRFVPSSGNVSCSASPITFGKNLSRYREENSSVKLQSELQPRPNSERVPSDPELSVDVTLTGIGIGKEELGLPGKDCGPDEQVMEVNFNLMEAFDFNDIDNQDLCERDRNKLTGGDVLSQSSDCFQGEDAAQNGDVMTHSTNEEKCLTFHGEDDGNLCAEGAPSQLCDDNAGDPGRIAEESANQTRTEVELLGDGHHVEDVNESQLSIEATNNKKDLDGCAARTINDVSWIKSKHSDLLPGEADIKECHPKTSMFEKTESISCVSTSRIISAVDKRTEEDVVQLGGMKSPEAGLEHLWGTKSDDLKPNSPLSRKLDATCGSFSYVAEDHQKVFGISQKEDTLISTSSICPLGKGPSSPEETAIGEMEFENAESINAFREACKGDRTGMDCLKCTTTAENSSDLPDLVNSIALLRALTQHSTALESLQKMEENNSVLHKAETSKEIFEPLVKDEAINQFTEMPYSESVQASSCSYFDSSGLMPNSLDNLLLKREACVLPIATAQRDPRTSDCQPKPVAFQGHEVKGSAASEIMLRAPCSQPGWQQYPDNTEFAAERFLSPLFSSNYVPSDFRQSPGSRNLPEDDTNFIREENFPKKSDMTEELGIDQSPLARNVYSDVPPRTTSGSLSHSDLRQTQWNSWQPDKMISSAELTSSLDPASGSEETIGDIQEPLTHRILPSKPELSEMCFTREKSSYPEGCSLSRLKLAVQTRTPFVTFPVAEEIPGAVYPTDSEEVQPSFGSSAARLCNKSAVFPLSAFGPEDRNDETSVFGEYPEERQRESIQLVFPKVTSQHRQSKWLKNQNSVQCDSITQNSDDEEASDDTCAENILGMPLGATGESSAVDKSAPGSAPLLTAKSILGKRCANTSGRDVISEGKLLSLHFSQTPLAEATQKVLSHLSCHTVTGDSQDVVISELSFPNVDKVKYAHLPKRKISIPTVFQSHVHYKQVFRAALTEQLNIILFELSQRLHSALSKVDVSFQTASGGGQSESQESRVPLCNHMHPAKLLMVKKEGQNQGRFFYACDAPKAERCSFFKWMEDASPTQIKSGPSAVLDDIKSIGTYLRSQKISVYEGCQLLVRRAFEIQTQQCSKFKKFMNTHARFDGDSKSKLYLKLSRKEHYSLYSKDDIWVVSKTLNFDPLDTFIASSAFFGPSSNNDVELLPLKGYCPSNWRSNSEFHTKYFTIVANNY